MTNQLRTNKIENLEPSKLSESIKSRGGDEQRIPQNIVYETYYVKKVSPTQQGQQQITKKTITQTQQIYGTQSAQANDQKFKKTKIHQVDKLNELKKQYEILRNIKIDDSFIYEQKVPKKEQSSVQASQKSIHSNNRSNHTNSKHKNHNLLQYQKKQLQLMLANSMNKIQELLKAQVQYKRKIYQLNSSRLNPQVTNQKYQQKFKTYQSSQKSNKELIQKLRFEQQKLRNVNFNLTERIRSIQSQNFNYQTEIRRMIEQKKRLQQTVMLEKQGHMNTKIQVKRFQLERDMIEKQKNNEVERFKRTIKDLQAQIQRLKGKNKQKQSETYQLNQKINQLTIQILKIQTQHTQQKDKNKQKINQIQKQREKQRQLQKQRQKERQKDRQRQRQLDKQKQKLNQRQSHKQKEKEKSESSENFQKKLAQKIKELQRHQQQQIKRQLGFLKQEIENMKQQNENSVDQMHLQIRIAALQKIITQDNQEKQHFLEELRRIIKDFQELQIQNEDLKQRLRKANRQMANYRQNSAYQLQRLQKSQQVVRASLNVEQVNNYFTKIRRLQAENKDLRLKLQKIQDSYSNTQSRTQQRVRQYSRRLEQSQFQIQKLLKQNQFNLQIANSKYKAEIEIAKNQTTRAIKQRNQQKARCQQMRSLLQLKMQSFKTQQQQNIKTSNQKIKNKDRQIQQIRTYADSIQTKVRQEYQKQFFVLVQRLDQLIKSNQRYVVENTRLVNSQGQLYQLRQRIRKMVGLSDGIDHLWQIKEAEYNNINLLMKQFRGQ